MRWAKSENGREAIFASALPRANPLIGTQNISQFLESLVRPHVIETDLETAYRQMALDESRETEALEWAEATFGDVQNETR
ncbi:MAG: hypothetical protein KAI83_02395 [Thiomargarita sp.]|nr:hypothetical protein [Thiomargarita sp.]